MRIATGSALKLWQGGVVVIGCRHNTAEFIEGVLRQGRSVAGVLTISENTAEKQHVPSWVDLSAKFGSYIPVYVACSYNLTCSEDREALDGTWADVGFCVGWQRLLPCWVLDLFRHGVYGMHASQFPLPRGIGRSPINWGLIHGADILQAHIFKYAEEPDSGSILETVPLTILPHDDIHSLQQKCRVIFNRVIGQHWNELLEGSVQLYPPQVDEPRLVYEKRTPDDGHLDWRWSVRKLGNWVRAQTHPYPGAFCLYRNLRYRIWHSVPFGLPNQQPILPGTVVERFYDGDLVVQAGDGPIHLLDHELPSDLGVGERLPCL